MRHAFEQDVWATLEFIPLSVRRKLDVAGIKISLATWQALPRDDRERLCEAPAEPVASSFREEVTRLVGRIQGQITPLPQAIDRESYRSHVARDKVLARAAELGLRGEPRAWDTLDDDDRYALVRLGEPQKREDKFKSALLELGMVPDLPSDP